MMHKLSCARPAFAVLGLAACCTAGAASPQLVAASLVDLSLEQLSNIVVSSVSRRDEPLSQAASSIYVITADDIRRSGAASIPEALRAAPNLAIAQVDANQYAISARGFNTTSANRMLVLIDGRTVYTPLFSGTFWDAQDVMLEDVERIEVISGPGATLWGANAVNGVINVITRSAAATQRGLLSAGAGSAQGGAAMRYGGEAGGGHYRVYGKTMRREHSYMTTGAAFNDGGDVTQVGFRSDWGKPGDGFTLQGDFYEGGNATAPQGRELSGANLLARWSKNLGEGESFRVQAYYDRTSRNHPGVFKEDLDTFDLELQHSLRRLGRHRIQWGLGLRHHRDEVGNSAVLAFLPAQRSLNRNSLFVQDEIGLTGELDLTLGAKFETNSYTGREFLPSARIGWRPAAGQLLWAAASRAVRAPSRLDRELFAPGSAPFAQLNGGPDFQSEVSRVYELGYRYQPAGAFSFSATAFYHQHESLRTVITAVPGPMITNDADGHTRGLEAWANWRVRDWWRLSGGFTRLNQAISLRPGVTDASPGSLGNDPSGWWKLRASFDLGSSHELDVMVRHYNSLPLPSVPAYTAVDARLGWRVSRDAELSVLLQNLTDRRHAEFGAAATRAEFPRSLYVNLRLALR